MTRVSMRDIVPGSKRGSGVTSGAAQVEAGRVCACRSKKPGHYFALHPQGTPTGTQKTQTSPHLEGERFMHVDEGICLLKWSLSIGVRQGLNTRDSGMAKHEGQRVQAKKIAAHQSRTKIQVHRPQSYEQQSNTFTIVTTMRFQNKLCCRKALLPPHVARKQHVCKKTDR